MKNVSLASRLAREYADAAIAEASEADEDAIPLLHAIVGAATMGERVACAHALLWRHDALTDPRYCIGQPDCDRTIQAIADALEYTP